MDITQIIIAAVAVLGSLVSFFASRHKSKSDLNKLRESNKADLEKLVKQHEIRNCQTIT